MVVFMFFFVSFFDAHTQSLKLAEVRSAATAKVEEITKDIENKLTTAELNREKEIQKKLDFVKKEVCFRVSFAWWMLHFCAAFLV